MSAAAATLAFSAVAFVFTAIERRRSRKRQLDEYHSLSDDDLVTVARLKDKWEYDEELETYLRLLPKVELHVHLDGSLDSNLLFTHLESTGDYNCLPENAVKPWDNTTFPVRKPVQECRDHLDFHMLCSCRGKRSLHEMIKCFEIFIPVVRGNMELLEELAHDFVKRQAQQNVIYTEVRYSPHLLAEGGDFTGTDAVDGDGVVDAVTRGLRRGESEFGVTVNQIICCITWRPDWADDCVRIAQERRNNVPCAVVGIDIAAGYEHFDKENFSQLHDPHFRAFQRAQALNLNITLHAGEVDDPSNILSAVNNFGARRIGHGYRISKHPEMMKEMKERGIHFEVCPTSSVETGGWDYDKDVGRNWKEHPAVIMNRMGMNIGLNSDDPAVFDTSLTWQHRIAVGKMGLAKERLVQAAHDSINAAFVNDEEKDRLLGLVNDFVDGNGRIPWSPALLFAERVSGLERERMEES